ncbi:23S rRNA (cytosine(1962)-C(5))-methyltransferase [Handroanthus impetiginosus]|uniref:23S rRNA (Cytosine(1962)-C(5))-methyltransferase n=1 Tax=Handroanthus impetiginosus TaxID=429701 RepID=A0A2G9GT23_9LAMI|nr:23S rRNA (cytosine(1962)-C(5))-methyltransferase [Handroanthus impetiginosus]
MVLGSRFLMSRTLGLAAAPPSALTNTTLQEIASNHPKGIAKVMLKKGKTQLFKDGSPMVYSGAVDRIIGRPPPTTGDVVLVADGTEKPIGWGLYNSVSMFCVRLMQLEDEATRDPSCVLNVDRLLETRIDAAVTLRERLGLPSAKTNAYRLVNSEGDRLSGLIIDIFGDEAVVASSAAWVEKYKQQIKDCISKINNIRHITWRPSIDILKEEGLDLSDSGDIDLSNSARTAKVVENGISYLVSLGGQKTGFYADQRENRQYISSISKGQKVLDICCYTGGFALNAAVGGALSVTGVDSSGPAVGIAKENIVLNNLDSGVISFLRQDATAFMKSAISRGDSWDIVILDPPKLAPHKKVLQSASGMYRNLNSLAMKITRSGGLLMTCSCSGAMTQSGKFLRILQGAASMAGRKITVIREAGAACDHPIDPCYPEGEYLSNVLLRIA